MSQLRHLVLSDPGLRGPEYGVLRDFEDEICRVTGGSRLTIPVTRRLAVAQKYCANGFRYRTLRKFFPRADLPVAADVVWAVLMGPENLTLDLFRQWDKGTKKILYLFDTMPTQMPALKFILSRSKWDLLLCSFPDAVEVLKRETGLPWTCIPQGVLPARFRPVPFNERQIGFSSYGRRIDSIHQAVQEFCAKWGIYYDFSLWSGLRGDVSNLDAYRAYAWHLSHSVFTLAYPVETTHPARAGSLSPITCRWFEAAAAATPIVGMTPSHPEYKAILGNDFHVPLDPKLGRQEALERLEVIWRKREELSKEAVYLAERDSAKWTWESRVRAILDTL